METAALVLRSFTKEEVKISFEEREWLRLVVYGGDGWGKEPGAEDSADVA